MEPGGLGGSKLPLIMVKGKPVNLYKMTLAQLQRFVPFMVLYATKSSLPKEIISAQLPPWWTPDIPFCQSVLFEENLPANELIERLHRIVTTCYRHHYSTYIIHLSSHLSGHTLTFVEMGNGTCKIIDEDNNQELVAVIRSATRHYDDDRSNTLSGDKRINSSLVATDFKKTLSLVPLLVRIDDPQAPKPKPETNMMRQLRSSNPRIVADDITNQLKSESQVEVQKAQSKSSKAKITSTIEPKPIQPPKKGWGKKRKRNAAKQTVPEPGPNPVPRMSCKYCHSGFPEEYLCLEHEDVCRKIPPDGQDLRDFPERSGFFAEALGLVPIKPTPAPENLKADVDFKKNLTADVDVKKNLTADVDVKKNLTADVDVKEPEFIFKIPLVPAKRNWRKVPARKKHTMLTFMKTNPIPISSLRGQEFLKKFGERKTPPISSTPVYEKYCLSTEVWPPPYEPKISTFKKHKIKDGQYVHHYTFGNNNRRRRYLELVRGMKRPSVKQQVIKFKRPVIKVIDLDLSSKKTMYKIEAQAKKKRNEIDIERIAEHCRPSIRLRNCIQDPEALTESQWKMLKINLTVPLIL